MLQKSPISNPSHHRYYLGALHVKLPILQPNRLASRGIQGKWPIQTTLCRRARTANVIWMSGSFINKVGVRSRLEAMPVVLFELEVEEDVYPPCPATAHRAQTRPPEDSDHQLPKAINRYLRHASRPCHGFKYHSQS
jgi:hypothetical protein